MAKQLNVAMTFTADTTLAKAAINSLQTSLTQLLTKTILSSVGQNMSTGIKTAINDVTKLKSLLNASLDVNTGNLDLGAFTNNLNKSGTTLKQYATSLSALGSQGQQAFSLLARAIATADVPLRRTNGLLTEMWTTLKNTARWQITSSALHALIGTFLSAMGYAKGLDKSLNEIRIVSGLSADEMERFAELANKAAQSLSTTTKKYSDASLIFYQLGK